MNSLQNFLRRSLGIRSTPFHDHAPYKITIELDKNEFKSNENVTGKLLIEAFDSNIKDIGKICVKFYDELDIQWEEYVSHTLYNTIEYKTLKRPLKINSQIILDPKNAIVDTVENSVEPNSYKHQQHLFYLKFEFELPKFIHSTVTMPNASYAYYIEALVMNNEESVSDKQFKLIDNFKILSNNSCFKTDVNIYNLIITPSELSLKPRLNQQQISEFQTSSFQIRATIPKLAYFSNETIPIKVDVEELAIAFNVATSTITTTTSIDTKSHHHHHHLKLNKIVFKLFQYCKINAEEPERKSKTFDYLIKQTTRKINEKCDLNSTKISLTEDFVLPDQLFSSTDRYIFEEFNRSNLLTPKKIPTLSYSCDEKSGLQSLEPIDLSDNDNSFNEINKEKFSYGVRVDYKLVIEIWKNFIHQDTICLPIKIDPEQY